MSAIEAGLLAATGLTAKRNEDRQEYLKRIIRAVSELAEEKWNALPAEQQDWFNKAADQMNKKQLLIDFPDIAAAPAAPVQRRTVTAPAAAATASTAAAATSAIEKPGVGDTILIKDAKGNEMQGVVKVVNDDQVELDSDDVLKWSKVTSCKVIKKAGATAAATEAKPAPTTEKPAPAKRTPPAKPIDGKPSVTQQMREMICRNIGKHKEEIAGLLKEAKVEFRESTLDIMWADTTKTIDTLRSLDKLKA